MHAKTLVKDTLRRLGYEIHRIAGAQSAKRMGEDPFYDMAGIVGNTTRPILFDVGANVGQTVQLFRDAFNSPIIHAFEPGRDTFIELQANTHGTAHLTLNNLALGAKEVSSQIFLENDFSDMSSFLAPSEKCWGSVSRSYEVRVDSVDGYCDRSGIKSIDVLKSDTQGFDLEVVRGASEMLRQHRIHLVYLEVIFSDMYKRLPRFDELYAYLVDRDLELVAFYDMHYQDGKASYMDALFVDQRYEG